MEIKQLLSEIKDVNILFQEVLDNFKKSDEYKIISQKTANYLNSYKEKNEYMKNEIKNIDFRKEYEKSNTDKEIENCLKLYKVEEIKFNELKSEIKEHIKEVEKLITDYLVPIDRQLNFFEKMLPMNAEFKELFEIIVSNICVLNNIEPDTGSVDDFVELVYAIDDVRLHKYMEDFDKRYKEEFPEDEKQTKYTEIGIEVYEAPKNNDVIDEWYNPNLKEVIREMKGEF